MTTTDTAVAVEAVHRTIRILIAEDQEVLRLGLKLTLSCCEDLEIVGEAADGPSSVEQAEELQPDLILMDLDMPVFGGIEATQKIKESTSCKILILSGHQEDDFIFPALDAGADGYCLKDIKKEALESAIKAVFNGGKWLDETIARRVLKSRPPEDEQKYKHILSHIESEVLKMLTTGKSADIIAHELEMTVTDVHELTKSVLMKTSMKMRMVDSLNGDKSQKPKRITLEHELAKRCTECFCKVSPELEECPYDGSLAVFDELIGSTFADRYEILSLIGAGTGGSVYKAKHKFMGKLVAIKVLHSIHMNKIEILQRFRQEATTVSRLQHPNVVSVIDFGVTEDGDAFMIMEYTDCVGLDVLIKKNGPLSPKAAIEVFKQICDGMQHAHEHGVFHRDLKPSNILVSKVGSKEMMVKVADFGTAKMTSPDEAPLVRTQKGQIFGTPLYMSPEQCQCRPLTESADIYSLGCMMYFVLTGQPPIIGEDYVDVMYKHINCKPLNIATVKMEKKIPILLQGIVMKTLRKEPELRHQSMEELKRYLEGIPMDD